MMESKNSTYVEELTNAMEAMKSMAKIADMKMTELDGFTVPAPFKEQFKTFKSFRVRPDDIFVCTFPKSGTTWLQHIVWLVMHGSHSVHTETRPMAERFPMLEFPIPGIKVINTLPSPRMMKTHLPLSFLPDEIMTQGAKVLYVARNPKDLIVSSYYYSRMFALGEYYTKIEECFDKFINNQLMLCPWVEHVKQYWNRREADNVLFLTYEEMSRDLQSCVKKVASFLGKELSEDEVEAICHHTSFTSMRDNNTTNFSWMEHINRPGEGKFMRKGKVGDWKTHLTPEISEKIEKLVEENLESLGLKMVYELDEEPQVTETA